MYRTIRRAFEANNRETLLKLCRTMAVPTLPSARERERELDLRKKY